MDSSCLILTCLLLLQMILILIMLNPVYDVRKLTKYLNYTTKRFKRTFFLLIGSYFSFVIYLGMYIPLQNIQLLIFSNDLTAYEKLTLLSRIEKNYIVAGFSLFLVVVLYGVRSLLSYTANLAKLTKKSSEQLVLNTRKRVEDILPNLLKVKRSISYEAILCTNELKEHLKVMMKNIDLTPNRCTLSSILETSSVSVDL